MLKASNRVHRLLRRFLRPLMPVEARHREPSALLSADDDHAVPTDRLIDIALRAVEEARSASMSSVSGRMAGPPYFPDVWPGEHYKLLAGLMTACRPKTVVEIGTATGLSALAMLGALPPGGRLISFDIIAWDKLADTHLRPEDFKDGSFRQIIGDVSDSDTMRRHAELFQSADIIFADGPKDGCFEGVLLDKLEEIGLPKKPIIVLDDIRLWNMLAIWRSVRRPKLDLTSFGHWSGTGLIDWVDAKAASKE